MTSGAIATSTALEISRGRIPPGCEERLHRHDHDEACYVLGGEVTVQIGPKLVVAGEGRAAFVPGGVAHGLANRADEEACLVTVSAPPPGEDELVGGPLRAGPARPVPEVPGRVKVLVRGADGSGRLAVMDNVIEAGHTGPKLHHHPFDEAFYVLEGVLAFRLEDRDVACRAGELALARGGTSHTFANLSGAEARTLIACAPAGFERYFEQVAAHEVGRAPSPEPIEEWPEITVVGPRIGEREPGS